MAAKSYVGKNGETLWEVFAYARGELNSGIKVEKTKTGVKTEREAQRLFKELQRECEREVLIKQDFPRKLRLISLSEPSYRWSSGIVEPPLASVAGLRASTAA